MFYVKRHVNLKSLMNCELILKIKSLGKVFFNVIFNQKNIFKPYIMGALMKRRPNNLTTNNRNVQVKTSQPKVFLFKTKLKDRSTWVAQSVKPSTSAQVMIFWFLSQTPTRLCNDSMEPVWDSLSLPLSLGPSPTCVHVCMLALSLAPKT